MISKIQIQIIIKFGTAKSINRYLRLKKFLQILNIRIILNHKYVFIDSAAPNYILNYTFSLLNYHCLGLKKYTFETADNL